jgi:hypothetical protein
VQRAHHGASGSGKTHTLRAIIEAISLCLVQGSGQEGAVAVIKKQVKVSGPAHNSLNAMRMAPSLC